LKNDGLYIFDIANLNYFLQGNNICDLTIDWVTVTDDTRFRDIQYSIIDTDGTLTFYTTSIVQKRASAGLAHGVQMGYEKPKITKSAQTLQIYTADQLKELLNKNGFKVIEQCGIDGSQFVEDETDRILTVAQKQ
jgi:hypothetical protein